MRSKDDFLVAVLGEVAVEALAYRSFCAYPLSSGQLQLPTRKLGMLQKRCEGKGEMHGYLIWTDH